MRRLQAVTLVVAVVAATLVATGSTREAKAEGTHSPNMEHVANLAYEQRYGQSSSFGTDIELRTYGKRNYAFAGTYRNGLQIIDVTKPESPKVAAVWDCAIAQGDVQLFERGKRVFVAYTADDISSNTRIESGCYQDVGYTPAKYPTPYGTFVADVTNPRKPKTVGFMPLATGSHNQSVHPGGRYFYNSNSDLDSLGVIEVFDLKNFRKPKLVTTLTLGPGLNSHDITFSSDGKRAYSAAVTESVVLDTTDPAAPEIIGRVVDPAVNIHHQSDPITLEDPILGERTFLIVTDELAGAAGNGFCPGGGLHVYDITGELEATPLKVGFWEIPEFRPAGAGDDTTGGSLTCTSHVLRMYPKQKLMTIAWYNAGVRVVDISGLAGISVGVEPGLGNVGAGMAEVGFFHFPDSDTWSVKANKFAKDGSFYMFANDIARGLDVFKFSADAAESADPGRWLTPAQYEARLGKVDFGSLKDRAPFCLLPAL
jgi:hypothetical protein